jgi:hypothetical protein
MSDVYDDWELVLRNVNRTLFEKRELILWKINRIEQLEWAVSSENVPFWEIPHGGFPAHVIGETMWTQARAAWQRASDTRTLSEAEDLIEKADVYIAWLDEEQARASRSYNHEREWNTRVFDDWRY